MLGGLTRDSTGCKESADSHTHVWSTLDHCTERLDLLVGAEFQSPCELFYDTLDLSAGERLDQLSELTSATWVFDNHARVWYRAELTERVLQSAQHPWRSLDIPPGSIMDIARTVHGEPPDSEWEETLADHPDIVDGIESKVESLPGSVHGPLIFACRLGDPPFVVDGNYRAAAVGVHLLRTGKFVPADVYLGYRQYTRITSLMGRTQMIIYRLRHC